MNKVTIVQLKWEREATGVVQHFL